MREVNCRFENDIDKAIMSRLYPARKNDELRCFSPRITKLLTSLKTVWIPSNRGRKAMTDNKPEFRLNRKPKNNFRFSVFRKTQKSIICFSRCFAADVDGGDELTKWSQGTNVVLPTVAPEIEKNRQEAGIRIFQKMLGRNG